MEYLAVSYVLVSLDIVPIVWGSVKAKMYSLVGVGVVLLRRIVETAVPWAWENESFWAKHPL
eukprot:5645665-Amphidinium_carterae.1